MLNIWGICSFSFDWPASYFSYVFAEAMAVPLLDKKVVKKRVTKFKRHHSDRYACLKVFFYYSLIFAMIILEKVEPHHSVSFKMLSCY